MGGCSWFGIRYVQVVCTGHMRNENKVYGANNQKGGDETNELLSVRHILPTVH
jgi:hypothetical protein